MKKVIEEECCKEAQSSTRVVQLFAAVVSGCTGRHFVPIYRRVHVDSTLRNGDIVHEVEADDMPIDPINP